MLLVLTMLLDLFSLTALLYFSGGPRIPFITFYLVNLALAAILLPSIWSWVLTALAISSSTVFLSGDMSPSRNWKALPNQ
jgi:two-component system, sensor histidine kinase RegB